MKRNSSTFSAVKKILVLCLLLVSTGGMYAQDKGMEFEHGSTWKAILSKAKKEKKFIFVDCFTTWCGPCKYMSSKVFPQEEVGTFYNKNFINAKFQLDTTAKDNEAVKAQYADAAYIMKTYKIRAYPTYLFFNPDGELVHQALGSSEAAEFISKGKNALDPEQQYFTQVKRYNAGERNPAFLKRLAIGARDAFDEAGAAKYAGDFLASKPNMDDKDNIRFVFETTSGANDAGFAMMLNDPAKFEAVVGKNDFHNALAGIISNAEFKANAESFSKWDEAQWDEYAAKLKKQYPDFSDEIITRFKTSQYKDKKDWTSFAAVINQYSLSKHVNISELNDHAWTIFTHCSDPKILETALQWSKLTFENEKIKEPGFIDTYANILYKLGKKEEALTWEKKAQALAIEQGNPKDWGQDVIDKINKDVPTW